LQRRLIRPIPMEQEASLVSLFFQIGTSTSFYI
jgi:GH24 family phage-related lysozyme (muramidase)